ncbi:MAG: hypothetical protein QJR03_03365 [Sphaerobacter sp.]|nr:hypothetical protein [Sphaerobacter sp.]
MDRRVVPALATIALVVLGWVLVRGGRRVNGAAEAAEPPQGAQETAHPVEDLFDDFPETDNPDVVRMVIAWRLAERLGGSTVRSAKDVERQLARFGHLYRRIARLTR